MSSTISRIGSSATGFTLTSTTLVVVAVEWPPKLSVASATTDTLTVAVAQIAPVWLDRDRTITKVEAWAERAAAEGAGLVAFGEALVPGYPWWLEHTDAARFDDMRQKEWFAHYTDQSCEPDRHFKDLAEIAREHNMAIVVGCMERALDRGGHSIYCSAVTIGQDGSIQPTHRKLMPTHEERLVWAQGDGHGLRTNSLPPFHMGVLNCWENWMPLPRAADGLLADLGKISISNILVRRTAKDGRPPSELAGKEGSAVPTPAWWSAIDEASVFLDCTRINLKQIRLSPRGEGGDLASGGLGMRKNPSFASATSEVAGGV